MLEEVSDKFKPIMAIISGVKKLFGNMLHWLWDWFAVIPLAAWLALLIGVIIVICTIYFTKYFVNRPEGEKKAKVEIPYKIPPIGGAIGRYLATRGFFKISRLAMDFMQGLDFLESTIKSKDYKYKNSWILVIGPQNSGKTTLVKSLTPIEAPWKLRPEIGRDAYNCECNWNFLANGVALDVRGDFFVRADSTNADELGWNSLKNLLIKYRPAKPIDSLLLTISAEDLYGKDRMSQMKCLERAKFMAKKISFFQEQLKLRIPIYVVITKSDIIPGFQDFCRKIPIEIKKNMFGWSNPYSTEANFSISWIIEAINHVSALISKINMDIFCENISDQQSDSLFVFPHEIKKIQDNLLTYLSQVFIENNYKTCPLLRGIYFVGDSEKNTADSSVEFIDPALLSSKYSINNKEEELEEGAGDNSSAIPEENENAEALEKQQAESARKDSRPNRIFFFRDVVYQKILLEGSVCVPQKGILPSINKSLLIAKVATCTFALGGGAGLYFSYSNLKKTQENLGPTLNSMYRFLVNTQKIPLVDLSQKNEAFESSIKQLTNILQNFSEANTTYVFLPISWFSPLKSRLNESVNLAYQTVIMRALYVNLLLKARHFFNMSSENIEENTSIAHLALPMKSNEFKAMNDFVKGLTELTKFVDKFNDLRIVNSSKSLEELASYAFNITLSKSFVKYYNNMKDRINTQKFPAIDLTVYKGQARETLSKLFQEFFNTVFINSHPQSFPAQLGNIVLRLMNAEGTGLPDLEYMRKLSSSLNVVLNSFCDTEEKKQDPNYKPKLTWMDKDIFEPGEEFEDFLKAVDNSPFFGTDVSQAIFDNCAIGLFHLKKSLVELTQILTTDTRFGGNEPTDEEEAAIPNKCSQGLILLGQSLKKLFGESYMKRPRQHRFMDKIPEGQTLYWDHNLLQAACELCKQFENFSTQAVGSFPVILQEKFRLLAKEGLQRNIISLVAQAQNFVTLPSNAQNPSVAEELIRSKSANTRQVFPLLLNLLELLNSDSVSFFFVSLRNLLLDTNYWHLNKINELMKLVGPYHVWDPSFSWWDGKKSPACSAYGVKDFQDLKAFLDTQSKKILNLATNLAKPVVDFLNSDIMLSVDPLDREKLTKWTRIVSQAEAFQKNLPGNSIAVLETFITNTLNEYTIDNVFEKINLAEVNTEVGDHFLETKQFIQKGVLGRAEVLIRQKNMKNYRDMANFFNKYLRGRFPFTPPASDLANAIDADPEDVRNFFSKFKEGGGTTEKCLDQIYQLGDIAKNAVNFLKNMEKIYEILQPYLDSDIGALPFINISTDFNVNTERAVGYNYIAEWSLRANLDETINNSTKVKQTRWVYGAPTEVGFRWPKVKGLLEAPFNDPNQPSLVVLDNLAKFTYKGKWSIIRLIRHHRAAPGEYVPMLNNNSIVLKFVIPVAQEKNAVLYNSISFLTPSANPNLPGKILLFPDFPVLAPDFSPDLERYRDEPVISLGFITPISITTLYK